MSTLQPEPCNVRSTFQGGTFAMLKLLLWLLLLMFSWPLALLVLVLYPFLWLLALPFRLVGITVEGVLELVRALFLLPARILGAR
jgi:hypothetical protein